MVLNFLTISLKNKNQRVLKFPGIQFWSPSRAEVFNSFNLYMLTDHNMNNSSLENRSWILKNCGIWAFDWLVVPTWYLQILTNEIDLFAIWTFDWVLESCVFCINQIFRICRLRVGYPYIHRFVTFIS